MLRIDGRHNWLTSEFFKGESLQMRIVRKLSFMVLVFFVILLGTIYVLANLVDSRAGDHAKRIIASLASEENMLNHASNMTMKVHFSFTPESDAGSLANLLRRLRPYWTNSMVPTFLRPREGALDLLVTSGLCDTYARALVFVIEQAGYEAAQLNMVSRSGGGHSIAIMRSGDGQVILLDPMFALVALHKDEPIGPEELRALVNSGSLATDLWRSLISRNHAPSILDTFDYGDMVFAEQGYPLHMVDKISLAQGEVRNIGDKNGLRISYTELEDAGLYVH